MSQMHYTCTYEGHENEQITGFCLNLRCSEKNQCCSQCLVKKHKGHALDCKSLLEIKKIIDENILTITAWQLKVEEAFKKVQRVYQIIGKLLVCGKNQMMELEKKYEQSNFLLYNNELVKLKKWNAIIIKLFSKNQNGALQSKKCLLKLAMLNKMVQFSEQILRFRQTSNPQKKQNIQIINYQHLFVEQGKIYDIKGKIFKEKIIVTCSGEYCNQESICDSCIIKENNSKILILLKPIIRNQLIIINQWISIVDSIHEQTQNVYKSIASFLPAENEKMKFLNKCYLNQEIHKISQNVLCLKRWESIQQFYLKKQNNNIFQGNKFSYQEVLLTKLVNLFEALQKTEASKITEMLLFKENKKRPIIINELINLDLSQKKHPKGYINQGNDLYNQRCFQEALACYDQAIKMDPNFSVAFNNKGDFIVNLLGLALFNLKRYKDAISCYDQAIIIDPSYQIAFNNKGMALNELQLFQEAIQCYDQAIYLDQKYSFAFYNKGNSLSKQGRYADSIKCYDQAISLDPGYPNVFYNKGTALENLKRFEEAIICYDQAIILNPNFYQAINNKSAVLELLNKNKVENKYNDYVK